MVKRLKTFAGATTALALCVSPTMARAAIAAPIQPLNPLVAVSVFGTQASAQEVCANPATAAAAAGAAAAAQGQTGCVLPATDAPPPPPPSEVPPPPRAAGLGISPILLGLLGIAGLAALIALGNEDSNSPDSPD
jgi:hypothetical protein